MAKLKILIIEDEQTLLKALVEKFSQVDFQVVEAIDGEIGLKLSREENPDLILLDLILPRVDGITLLKELKKEEKTKKIPVIVLTNLSDDKTIGEVVAAGGTNYMVKADYSLDDMVRKVKEVLKRKIR